MAKLVLASAEISSFSTHSPFLFLNLVLVYMEGVVILLIFYLRYISTFLFPRGARAYCTQAQRAERHQIRRYVERYLLVCASVRVSGRGRGKRAVDSGDLGSVLQGLQEINVRACVCV